MLTSMQLFVSAVNSNGRVFFCKMSSLVKYVECDTLVHLFETNERFMFVGLTRQKEKLTL